ncbi:MAG: glutamate-5-semialdehyde dehydrogenase [Ardenticatenia bacterium]|nr:MAG: glutamate-5-semialdehyde dehydrogenase [Ardenticatenia bacterium]
MSDEIKLKGEAARRAARQLAILDTDTKNRALQGIAEQLIARQEAILEANACDVEAGRAASLSEAMIDRLLITPQRLQAMARDVLAVMALPDPVGEVFDGTTLPNGLQVAKRRVPIGVIGVIYESRPNVTVDVSVLCLKSGNAVILRGGKEAVHTNVALTQAIVEACRAHNIPEGAVQIIESQDRALVLEMLRAHQYIDMIIPRGGASLHEFARQNATIPVITGGVGICHIYVDRTADLSKALPIIHNAKTQRPTVCNALDTLLVHQDIAATFLPQVADMLAAANVELRCEPRALAVLEGHPAVRPASPADFDTEFLSLVLAVKVVDGLEEALEHIHLHSTHHSDAILTEDYSAAMRFVNEVDSAAVYVNASTRFTDGGQFGLGAEVAISTQRLHARGPMGLRELTTYKWVIFGNGQVRA